ncbi:hypothetical protein ACIA49_06655 [Kribbella sp. NPDC051587]|uniref:hypothetical protein n=1 Tax=Kribbella sp. NPDC051587 TaxID=3364119 RepID=UPI00378C8C22
MDALPHRQIAPPQLINRHPANRRRPKHRPAASSEFNGLTLEGWVEESSDGLELLRGRPLLVKDSADVGKD